MSELTTEEREKIENDLAEAKEELKDIYDGMNSGYYTENSMSTDMNYAINKKEELERKIAGLKRKLDGKSDGCTISGGRRRYKKKRSTKRRKTTKRRRSKKSTKRRTRRL
jgi:hypothetical protein